MAKAVVCIASTQIVGENATLNYSVSVLGPPNYMYSSDYTVDVGISVAANLTAWRNKVITLAAEKGITLTLGDVIICGAPV
jgi:hypothetical protein